MCVCVREREREIERVLTCVRAVLSSRPPLVSCRCFTEQSSSLERTGGGRMAAGHVHRDWPALDAYKGSWYWEEAAGLYSG